MACAVCVGQRQLQVQTWGGATPQLSALTLPRDDDGATRMPFNPHTLGAPSRFRSFHPQQRDALFRFINSGKRFMALVMPTGCHARRTKVVMADGSLKAVEAIRIGDRLLGPDSSVRTVLQLHRGEQEMVRVTPVKGESFVVNRDHLLSVYVTKSSWRNRPSERSRYEVLTAGAWEGKPKSFRHIRKLHRASVLSFKAPSADLKIDSYFLGVLLGDGTLERTIGVCSMDQAIVDEVYRQAAKWRLDVRVSFKCAGNRARDYYFTGRRRIFDGARSSKPHRLMQEITRLGLRVSCAAKFVPKQYLTAGVQLRRELLAGLLDTDGHLSHGHFEFVNKSKQLAVDVLFLARSLGLAAYSSIKRINEVNYIRVSISGDTHLIPTRIPRKQASPRRQIKSALVTGFTVEPAGVDHYYGFELDGDHLYMTDDFTIHHNSGKSLAAWSFAAATGMRTLILTASRFLETQYSDDFEPSGTLSDIRGQQNYVCHAVEPGNILQRYRDGHSGGCAVMCDRGPCHHGVYCKLISGGCDYYDAVRTAVEQPLVVSSNYSYWISQGKALRSGRTKEEPLGQFDLVVCDEAHEAAREVGKALKVELWEDELRRFTGAVLPMREAQCSDWARWAQKWLPMLEEMLSEFRREVSRIGLTGVTADSMRRLRGLREGLEQVAMTSDEDWVVTRGERKVVFEAVWVRKDCEELLYRGVEKVVLMSATLTEKDVEELGAA